MPNVTDSIKDALCSKSDDSAMHGTDMVSLENLETEEDAPFSSHGTTEIINDAV